MAGLTGPAAELLLNFISILFEKNRFGLMQDVAVSFKMIADEAQGELPVVLEELCNDLGTPARCTPQEASGARRRWW